MSSHKGQTTDNGGIHFSARRLSTPDLNDINRNKDDGLYGSQQQTRYSIPRFVASVYYRLGLLCASHPRFVLVLTFLVIVWSCFPLLSLPLYSSRPQIHQQTLKHFVKEGKIGTHLSEGVSSMQEKSIHPADGRLLFKLGLYCPYKF